MRWAGPVASTGEKRISVGNPVDKRPQASPRRRWEGNIKMYLKVIRWEDIDLIHLDQYRNQWLTRVNTVLNFRDP
jgi:predicted membrane protein